MIVVDASVAIAFCMSDEGDEYIERLLGRIAVEPTVAPSHWPLEVGNALLTAQRRGRIDASGIRNASRLLARLAVDIAPIELATALSSVLDTAREHSLTAYDAAYLELAKSRNAPLATLDEALRTACTAAGVPLVD